MSANLYKELRRKFGSYHTIFDENSPRCGRDTGHSEIRPLSTSGLHYGAKYCSTSSEHRPNCLTYAIVRSNIEPVTPFDVTGLSVTGRRLWNSFANPKSGLKQTRSRSRKAGFPTSVVCTLSRALLSC